MTNPQSAKPNRRTLLRTTGLTAAALATTTGATLARSDASSAPASATSLTPNDTATLYYALLFKYVTATFYLYATTGQGLSSADTGGIHINGTPGGAGGSVLGGGAVPFQTSLYRQYAENIAADELAHVRYLRTQLGGAAGALEMPTIDMTAVWTNLAVIARLIVPGQIFNPFADEISFLLGAYFFEDLCVSFECGLLSEQSDNVLLTYIGALSGADAYHAGTIRTLLAKIGGGEPVAKLSALRATLSGTPDTGILMPDGAVNIGPFGSQALMLTRTAAQGLTVLFLGADLTSINPSGGFFPSGIYV